MISHGGVSSNLWSYDVNLADGQWHNIVFTFDNGLHRHYVDGNLTAEETFQYSTMNVTNLTQTLIGIGMWNARFYEGLIDDYAVWDIALDSNQIDEIIENGINSNQEGLNQHLGFNDLGEGEIIIDQSGNGNNAINNGAILNESVSIPNLSLYTFDLELSQDNNLTIQINPNQITDLAGNPNTGSDPFEITFNGFPPNSPQNFAVEPGDQRADLSWDANMENDLESYFVYMQEKNSSSLSFDGSGNYITMQNFQPESDQLTIGALDKN